MVGANIPNSYVIGHNDENVRLLGLRLSCLRCREKCYQSDKHGSIPSDQIASSHSFSLQTCFPFVSSHDLQKEGVPDRTE
jgi:hypothetical protein